MYQRWHHLLFLHWEIPPQELQRLLPPRLTVDTFEGKAYVGLVPFTLTGVRPVLTPPLPWISTFHEVNVRTYVHFEGHDPGIWFFSLDASSAIAVAAARAAYKLPYFDSSIDMSVFDGGLPRIEFQSRRTDARGTTPANCAVQYQPQEGPAHASTPGTIEHFLIERYILYTEHENHLHRARVHHAPYLVQRAEVTHLEETLVWAAGIRHHQEPSLRHYAREADVKVYPLERC
jgi:uncharacterized protein YqjF (DUF2071 family)